MTQTTTPRLSFDSVAHAAVRAKPWPGVYLCKLFENFLERGSTPPILWREQKVQIKRDATSRPSEFSN
jgi:hypothetical protein